MPSDGPSAYADDMTREVAIVALDGYADSTLAVLLDVIRASAAIAVRAGRVPPLRATIVSPSGVRVRSATAGTRPRVGSLRALAASNGVDFLVKMVYNI